MDADLFEIAGLHNAGIVDEHADRPKFSANGVMVCGDQLRIAAIAPEHKQALLVRQNTFKAALRIFSSLLISIVGNGHRSAVFDQPYSNG